jgi:predicted amidohydrolase YtcJ
MNTRRTVASLAALILTGPAFGKDAADLVLYHGKVLTVDKAFSIKSAIVVKDGKVLAVGDDTLAEQYDAPTRIDLQGRVLMPGFMDNHLHPMTRGKRAIDAESAKSVADIQTMLRAKAKELGPGQWITGFGWAEVNLKENRNLTRKDLDVATPENPVVLTRAGGHSSVGNSLALKAAGITRTTEDPQRGVIEHFEDGEPNGIIRERSDLYMSNVPPDSPESLRPGLVAVMKGLPALGITSMNIASASIADELAKPGEPQKPIRGLTFKQLRSIYHDYGDVLPRAAVQITYPGPGLLATYPHKTGYGDDRLRLGAIGEAPGVDGGFTGPTAWTTHDYNGQPGFKGRGNYPNDVDLQAIADDVAKSGWQLGLHSIGDAAINQAVRVWIAALNKYPQKDPRWYLAHFTMIPTNETMDAMVKHHILANAQPNFLYTLENRYVETLNGYDLEHNNPVAVPTKRGVFVSFGSDNLPIDPRVGLYAAVTRKGLTGKRVYGAEEAVSIQDAIRMYTYNPTFLTWEETKKGTLEPGKFADFIILDSDPLTIAPEKLLTMHVLQTFIAGKKVYSAKN